MSLTTRLRAGLDRLLPQGKRQALCRPQLENLEDRTLLTQFTELHLDFNTNKSPTSTGYTGFTLADYNSERGYGWENTSNMQAVDRGRVDALHRDFHAGINSRFLVNVVDGTYDVSVIMGDPWWSRDRGELRAEGRVLATEINTRPGEYYQRTFQVNVTDGQLALQLRDLGGWSTTFAVNALDVVRRAGGPVVDAGANQSGNEGSSLSFRGTASGSGTLSYRWDFGDGASTTGTLTPVHTYADNGAYTVRLTVTDGSGVSNSDTLAATVSNVAPSAAHGGPYAGAEAQSITFTAAATDPSPADTAAGFTWAWNFGDGAASTQRVADHAYAAHGTYIVTLSVTDKDGGRTTTSTTAVISEDDGGPGDDGSGDWIETPHDRIPNYGKTPTIFSIQTGGWSNASTWSAGRLPTTGDIVAIAHDTVVTYDVSSAARLNTIIIRGGGELTFRTDVSTRVVVANLMVLEGGELRVGTAANPVAAGVTAEIVIANQALNTTFDPRQYGHGLLGFGKVSMHGAALAASFIRLAAEPHAGDRTLILAEAAAGWQVGDRVFLPDSRQLRDFERGAGYVPQWEELTVQGISTDGRTLTLPAALRFAHPGSRNADGATEFLPHVGNLSRNVIVRSENPAGTRGHVAFFHEADVDVRYALFRDLGRTTNNPLDNTTFNDDGSVRHVGTNQIGRYPVHVHHVHGPEDVPANGYQFTLEGNAIDNGGATSNFKWGMAIHDSHYGLIRNNVVYNVAGAGIAFEDGSESYNVVDRNFVVRVSGTGQRLDAGRDGDGFWFRGPNNYVRNNVVANLNATGGSGASSYAYNYFLYYVGSVHIPAHQGGAHDDGVEVDMNTMPIREFVGNEAYGALPGGLIFWHIGTFGDWPTGRITGDSVIRDFRVWNHYDYGIFGYPSDRVIIDGLVIRGNPSVVANPYEYTTGVTFSDYPTKNLIIRNANIQGMQVGIEAPYVAPGVTNIQNSYLRNVTDLSIRTMYSVNGSRDLPARRTIIRNTRFVGLPGLNHFAIDMEYDANHGNNLIQRDEVLVYDFNGNVGENYQVYYEEQRADFVVPKSNGNLIGSPVAGLTNQQNWTTYGIAIGGAVAPNSARRRSDIQGLIVSI